MNESLIFLFYNFVVIYFLVWLMKMKKTREEDEEKFNKV